MRANIRQTEILAILIAACGAAGVALICAGHLSAGRNTVAVTNPPPAVPRRPAAFPAHAAPRVRQSVRSETPPAPPETENAAVPPAAPASSAPPSAGGPPEPLDPDARAALSFVGVDPQAEQVWYAAINDPSLPEAERRDLIEDLNQDGFADPDNVTLQELPLVVSRLELIAELAPYAMDEVNADAFAEAQKDLVNIYISLTAP
jgi:hypothetical protein